MGAEVVLPLLPLLPLVLSPHHGRVAADRRAPTDAADSRGAV